MKTPRNTGPDPELELAVIFKNSLSDAKSCDICFTAIVKERGEYQNGEEYIDFRPSAGWKATVQSGEEVFVKWPPQTEFLVRMYVSSNTVSLGSMDTLTLNKWTGYSGNSGDSYECLCLHDKEHNPVANFYTTELITSNATQAALYRIGTIKGKGEDYGFEEGDIFVLGSYNSISVWDGTIKKCHEKGEHIEVTIKAREPDINS